MRERQVDHVVPHRPVLEDVEPGLRPEHALRQVLDGPLARDHPLDPLDERDLARADTASLHRVRELVPDVDLDLLRADRTRVAGRTAIGLDEAGAARTPEDGEGVGAAGAAVAEGHRAAGRAAPFADLGREHAAVHVRPIGVVRGLLERAARTAGLADRKERVRRRVHLAGLGFARPPHPPADPGPGLPAHAHAREVPDEGEGVPARRVVPGRAAAKPEVEAERGEQDEVSVDHDLAVPDLVGNERLLEPPLRVRLVRQPE